MPFVRVNTVFFDFRNTFFPSQLETHRWLRSLEITDGDVMIVDFNTYSKELVVKFSTEEKYLNFLAKGKGYYTIMRDGDSYDIPYRACDNKFGNATAKPVRIKYIPGEEDDLGQLAKVLENYGHVLNIFREGPYIKDPIILSGFRSEKVQALMVLKEPIPSFIKYKNEKINISYHDQPATCAHCDARDHIAIQCPTKRPRRWETVAVSGGRKFNQPQVNQPNSLVVQNRFNGLPIDEDETVQENRHNNAKRGLTPSPTIQRPAKAQKNKDRTKKNTKGKEFEEVTLSKGLWDPTMLAPGSPAAGSSGSDADEESDEPVVSISRLSATPNLDKVVVTPLADGTTTTAASPDLNQEHYLGQETGETKEQENPNGPSTTEFRDPPDTADTSFFAGSCI